MMHLYGFPRTQLWITHIQISLCPFPSPSFGRSTVYATFLPSLISVPPCPLTYHCHPGFLGEPMGANTGTGSITFLRWHSRKVVEASTTFLFPLIIHSFIHCIKKRRKGLDWLGMKQQHIK